MAANFCFKYTLCVEWTTELPSDGAPRESPHITLEGSEWYLKLEYTNAYFLYFMKVKPDSRLSKNIVITTSIKDSSALDNEPVLIERKNFGKSGGEILWFKEKENILDQIPNILAIGKCTIVCLFHNTEEHFEKKDISRQIDFASADRSPLSVDLQSLSHDFSTFLKDETFSDLKLICADRTFSAHRSVLAARSEVFAAMFRNKMAETEAGEVDIKDVKPEVLELLLKYLYSGKTPDLLETTARHLYEAADKYAVHALKATCSVWLVGNLTTLNCLDVLVLAEKHSDKQFVDAVADFSAVNLRLIKKESWSTFKDVHPELAVKVYDKFYEKLPSGK